MTSHASTIPQGPLVAAPADSAAALDYLAFGIVDETGQNVLIGDQADAQLARFLLRRAEPGQAVMDAAARSGALAVVAARLVGATGRVLAIEERDVFASALTRNLDAYANAYRAQRKNPAGILDLDALCQEHALTPDFVILPGGMPAAALLPHMRNILAVSRAIVLVRASDGSAPPTIDPQALASAIAGFEYGLRAIDDAGAAADISDGGVPAGSALALVPKERWADMARAVATKGGLAARLAPLIEVGRPVQIPFRGKDNSVLRDPNSGFLHLEPPTPEVLTDYYENEYGRKNPDYYKVDLDYDEDRCRYGVAGILGAVIPFGLDGPLEVHELGCAYGGLVAEMANRGHSATGSDINGTAIGEGRTIKNNLRICALPNRAALVSLDRKVDLIYTLHCLEHDPDLWNVMADCHDALTSRGLLYATVPNAMYARAMLDGFETHEWAAYPDHLHHLSPGFLPQFCDETGFEPLLVETRHAGDFDTWWRRHFGDMYDAPRTQAVWTFLLTKLGFGLELRMVLAPKGGEAARKYADTVARMRLELEERRRTEVDLRAFIAGLT